MLACASPAVDPGKLAELANGADWDATLDLAEQHGVLGLLSGRLNAGTMPPEALQRLRDQQRRRTFSALALTGELFQLCERLGVAGLAALPVKGPVLSQRAYGDPAVRQYGDLDLLIRQADIPRLTELLTDAGYEAWVPREAIAAGKIPGEYVFQRRSPQVRVEFHTERTSRYFPRPLAIEQIMERQTCVLLDGRRLPALSAEDDLLMLAVHGAKDLWARLIWLADVATLIQRETQLDWEFVAAEARRAGASRTLGTALQLATNLLESPLPERAKGLVDFSRDNSMARQIAAWMPFGPDVHLGLLKRSLFRIRMGGGGIRGAGYLLRLALSPTEDDWNASKGGAFDSPRRLMRLAGKYGNKPRENGERPES